MIIIIYSNAYKTEKIIYCTNNKFKTRGPVCMTTMAQLLSQINSGLRLTTVMNKTDIVIDMHDKVTSELTLVHLATRYKMPGAR